MPRKGWKYFHSSVIKNSSSSSSSTSWPLLFSAPSLASSRTLLTSFLLSFHYPALFWLSRFRIPTHGIPTCLLDRRKNSWPVIIHSYFILTHAHKHTHTHTVTWGGNKLMEWAVLFYYLWRKVYCFLLQRVELIYWYIPKRPNVIDLPLSDQSGEICVFSTDVVWQAEHICVCVCRCNFPPCVPN